MRVALIADAFPPLRSSAAVQMRDLSIAFAQMGHNVAVLVAAPDQAEPWSIERWNGVEVVRLKCPKTKDTNYVRRTFGEYAMPHAMLKNLRKSPLANVRWDGVAWYSPTIFLGPLVRALKQENGCRSYLIIRDIFPEWAVDMGLMGKGLPYRFFKAIANEQYSVADVIGIQSEGNRVYFEDWIATSQGQVEVLPNWLADAPTRSCSISVSDTQLAGRKIFVYAGNMGIAQGMGVLLDLAEDLRDRSDIGFVFVGRGSDATRLRERAETANLDNVVFFGEIEPDDIPGLYAQCHVGLVALDPRHKSHNIPGKFVSYMKCGLPVLACVNAGNDLVDLIARAGVGYVTTEASAVALKPLAEKMADELVAGLDRSDACAAVGQQFSPEATVRQIICGLSP